MTIRSKDNWINKSEGMLCKTCMWFVQKAGDGQIIEVGRCRRHAPTMSGYPVVYLSDWCGDHKLDADKLVSRTTALLENITTHCEFKKENTISKGKFCFQEDPL